MEKHSSTILAINFALTMLAAALFTVWENKDTNCLTAAALTAAISISITLMAGGKYGR